MTSSFTEDTSISLPGVSSSSVAWSDYNADGKPDFLLTGSSNSLVTGLSNSLLTGLSNSASGYISKLYKNTGSGFSEDTSISLPGVYYGSVAWSDYNGDGKPDLLLTGYDNSYNPISKLYKNTGSGFSEDTSISLPGVYASSVAWSDYNGDGKPDFLLTGYTVLGSYIPISKLYKNTGSGFSEDTSISLPGVGYSSVAWSDYNGDGKPDLLLTGYNGSGNTIRISKLYKNTGSGFSEDTSISLPGVSSGSVAWSDYTGDGKPDFLLTGGVSKLYKNTGSGFSGNTSIFLPGVGYSSVAWSDYNGDGKPDFLLTGYDNSGFISKLYKNTGSGFSEDTSISLPGVGWSSVAWSDYNGDSKPDFLLTGLSNSSYISKLYKNTTTYSDITPPVASSFTPSDNATNIAIAADLVVNFSEAIKKGSGNIVIRKADGTEVETLNVNIATNITVSGSQLTINPTVDLASTTDYYVEIADGAIQDIAGNNYLGISGNSTWNFQTADTTAPTANSFTPTDDATNIAVGADLVVNFSEAIKKGTVGDIVIKSDNSVVETIPVTATNITVSGSQLTINPTVDLASTTDYYVEIANGAIQDIAGNNYLGISGNSTWNFQTADTTAPTANTFTPTDDATNIAVDDNLVVNFSEDIKKGSGNIVIKKADGTEVETLDVNTATNITVSGSQLTINPTNDLASTTDYYVEIADGAIQDIAGNNYAGISGNSSWNFTTTGPSSGSFTEDTSISLPGVFWSSVAWSDYTGDGKPDFLLTGSSNSGDYISKLYKNTGSGFSEDTSISLPGVWGSSVAWSDYTGDGKPDFLLTGYTADSGCISKLYKNTGSGFSEDTSISLPGVDWGSVAWSDYNADGKPDFLLTGYSNSGDYISKLYKNTGSGFSEDTSISLPGVYYGSVAWSDYNADGKPDFLLTGSSESGIISKLYKNTGSGFSEDTSISLPGVEFSSVAWSDYNADGKPDLLLTGWTSSGRISKLYKNTGSGLSEDTSISLPGVEWGSVAWSDYNADGKPDFLLTGYDSPYNGISKLYKNTGSGFSEDTSISLPGVAWGSVAWSDYDADGKPDFLLTGDTSLGSMFKLYKNTSDTTPPTASIQGVKWNDQNSNGVLDTGEEALSGWTIYLDGNQNGQLETGELSTVTNANGEYSFSNLGAGEYTIGEVSQSGWEQTYPTNPYSINLKTGGITGSPNPDITLISSPTDSNNDGYYEAVVKLNYEGALDQVKFVVDYDAVPTGWTVDIGDSVSNDGFGGDGGDTSNAAETQIMDARIDVYTNTLPDHELVTDDGHLHILRVPNIVTGSGSQAILEVSDEHLGWDNLQGVKGTLDSPYLYTLNGQATTYGPVDYDVYASFNRVINNTYRLGTGASQITIIPVNTATHTVNLAAGETATDVNFGNREVNIDTTPPTASSFTPTDDATNIAVADNLVVNFSEDIKKGTGDIVIKKVSDNSVVETIAVTADNITVSGSQLTINPTENLAQGTDYYVEIADGAIQDIAGNNYAGISGNSTWNFQTQGTNPINGTAGADNLTGTADADVINGLAGNDTLSGLAGNDILDGGNGSDRLDGGLGADQLKGGTGNDTYVVDDTGDIVTELLDQGTDLVESSLTYTLPDNVEKLTLTGTTAIDGTGNNLANTIKGNTANNTLNGGTGADKLKGGTGDDTYIVDDTGDVVTELVDQGTDLVESSVTYTLPDNVEKLTLTGTTAINGTGNNLANTINGNSANNTLKGGKGNDLLIGNEGADQLKGGKGNDTYVVDDTGDVVTELAYQGTDLVESSVTYTLPDNVEKLTLTGTTAINGTGNNLANTINGNSANNTLNGGKGNDLLIGNQGDDQLNGGVGNDTLTGGLGADKFIYDTNAAFATSAVGVDTITDFTSSQTDQIVLDKTTFNRISSMAGTGFSVASEFAQVTTDALAATSAADIVYNTATGGLFYNQNGTARGFGSNGGQFLTLTEKPALTASQFLIQA